MINSISLRAGAAVIALLLAAALLPAASALAKGDSSTPSLLPGGNSKEPVNIEADRLEYWNKDQKAIYFGNVIVVQGETTMKCSKLTIYINRQDKKGPKGAQPAAASNQAPGQGPSNDSVRHMDADGPVTLISKDQVGTGDRLEYDKPKNNVTIIGHVVLTQGQNVTKGDLLTYDLTTGVAHIESGASAGRVSGYFIPGSNNPAAGKDQEKPKDAAAEAPKSKKGGRGGGRTASRQKRTE